MRTVVSRECGFARNASESDLPGLWRNLEGWWSCQINQRGGLVLRDVLNRNNGSFNAMESADWVVDRGYAALQFDGSESVRINRGFSYQRMTQSVWFKRSSTSALSCFVGTGMPLTTLASNDRFVIQPWSDGQVYISFRGSTWGNFTSNDLNLHNLVAVYDGTKATNSERLIVYFDGRPQPLSFTGTIPANIGSPTETAIGETYAGVVLTYSTGCVFDYRIYSRCLTRAEGCQLAMYPHIGSNLAIKRKQYRSIATTNRRRRILTGIV